MAKLIVPIGERDHGEPLMIAIIRLATEHHAQGKHGCAEGTALLASGCAERCQPRTSNALTLLGHEIVGEIAEVVDEAAQIVMDAAFGTEAQRRELAATLRSLAPACEACGGQGRIEPSDLTIPSRPCDACPKGKAYARLEKLNPEVSRG